MTRLNLTKYYYGLLTLIASGPNFCVSLQTWS